jgi:hypothetical protein
MKLSADLELALQGLPGEVIIRQGLDDLAAGQESIGSCLVQIGATRLRDAGLPVPENVDINADRSLYRLLEAEHGTSAHSQYNSWIRQLVSFERALEGRARNKKNRA